MHPPLASRIALITGAASGLGKATAERFVKQGARVVLCDLKGSSDTATTAKTTTESLETSIFVPTDVTHSQQISNALDAAEAAFGRPIDTIVNCAGIGLARKTLSIHREETGHSKEESESEGYRVHDQASFERVLQINASGTFNVVRLAVERMVQARASTNSNNNHHKTNDPLPDGVIVNTASIAAYDGQIGQVAYAASKAAIVGMTLPLARELAPYRIRANAIAPGLFRTPLLEGLPETVQRELGSSVPFPSRLGSPDEFAMLVQSIVENPMINGEVIRIDGGLRMPPN